MSEFNATAAAVKQYLSGVTSDEEANKAYDELLNDEEFSNPDVHIWQPF